MPLDHIRLARAAEASASTILDILNLNDHGGWVRVHHFVVVLDYHAACCFVALLLGGFGRFVGR